MRLPFKMIFLSLLLAGSASAKSSVFINDVKVDGLKSQRLVGVDVFFDDNGDVHITAKGYKVQAAEQSPEAKAAAAAATEKPSIATSRFYIAAMQPDGRSGMSQWDIDVYINQVWVKKFQSKEPEPVFEITRFLKPGDNQIHFAAKKEAGERQSVSPNDYIELIVGNGEMRAGQVMLSKLASYRRTAADSGTHDAETVLKLASP